MLREIYKLHLSLSAATHCSTLLLLLFPFQRGSSFCRLLIMATSRYVSAVRILYLSQLTTLRIEDDTILRYNSQPHYLLLLLSFSIDLLSFLVMERLRCSFFYCHSITGTQLYILLLTRHRLFIIGSTVNDSKYYNDYFFSFNDFHFTIAMYDTIGMCSNGYIVSMRRNESFLLLFLIITKDGEIATKFKNKVFGAII